MNFCKAIVDGIDLYLAKSGEALYQISEGDDVDYEGDSVIPFAFDNWGVCIDDVSGVELPWDLVRAGRQAEID